MIRCSALHLAFALLTACLLPARASATGDCNAAADATLPALIEALAWQGRLHGDEAAGCLQRLDALAARDATFIVPARLAAARRALLRGELDDADHTVADALAHAGNDPAMRASIAVTQAEIAITREKLADAALLLQPVLADDSGIDGIVRLRAQLAISRVDAFRRQPQPCLHHAQAALDIVDGLNDAAPAMQAQALVARATCRRLAGDHGASLQDLDQALALQPPDRDDSHPLLVAQTLLLLAQGHKITGNFEDARRGYARTMAYLRAHPEPVPYQLAGTLHGLANLERDENRVEASLPLYDEALDAFQRLYGAQSSRTGNVHNNHGNALGLVGRYDEAIAAYRTALAIAQHNGDDRDPATLLPIANIALVQLWQRRFPEAEAGFREYIALNSEAPGSENSATFAVLGLASALWGQQRHGDALALAERSERERQLAVATTLSTLPEEVAIGYQEHLRPGLDMALAIAVDSGEPALVERAWNLAMRARGQVTSSTASRLAAARSARDPQVRQMLQDWHRTHLALARLQLSHADGDDAAHALREARRAAQDSERDLARALPATAAQLDPAGLDLQHLRRRRPDGAVLVSYVTSMLRSPDEYAQRHVHQRPRDLHAFTVDGDQPPRLLRLLDERELDALVSRWRGALAAPDSDLAALHRSGRHLRQRIVDPLGVGMDRLILMVPHGDLHQVNMAALSADDDRYLLELGLRVHTLNHERDLLQTALPTRAATQVLAVSDPAFGGALAGGAGARTDACSGQWPALPGSRREVQFLREALPEQASVAALQGDQATRDNVLAALPDRDLVHLATHGLRRSDGCPPNARGLSLAAADDDAAPGNAGIGVLVLAQAGADTFLSESDIAVLPMERTQWVVLSACETGLGDSRAYEGAFGLRRAFHLAGARTVIMSLWAVHDEATADWMAALYQARLVAGSDTPTAVQQAQQQVLARRRDTGQSDHPYYWAGFIAAGDWR